MARSASSADFPKGVTKGNHNAIRDKLFMGLLRIGVDVHGDWDDWVIEATGATQSQIWGSERTYYRDRNFAWFLVYHGDLALAKDQSGLFGSRYDVKECILPGTKVTLLSIVDPNPMSKVYIGYNHVGQEFVPPPQEERGEFVAPKAAKTRVIEYTCNVCGHKWYPSRRYKDQQIHVKDRGSLELTKFELVAS